MKKLVKWGLVGTLLFSTAMPAMAKTWDVCIDPSTDLNASTETVMIGGAATPVFFSGAAAIFPAGTFTSSSLTSCATGATSVGTFFVKGSAVGNLPADSGNDVFFVDWYFAPTAAARDRGGSID